jgi:hypothetical protein
MYGTVSIYRYIDFKIYFNNSFALDAFSQYNRKGVTGVNFIDCCLRRDLLRQAVSDWLAQAESVKSRLEVEKEHLGTKEKPASLETNR